MTTLQIAQRRAVNMEHHLRRAAIRERVTGQRREMRRETNEEIRAAVRGVISGTATD